MNFYFNFTDGSSNRHIRADEFSNSIKTNMSVFKLSVYAGSKIEYKKITKYRLVIEKEQSGSFYYYKDFVGVYDSTSSVIYFNGTLGGHGDGNVRFKTYLEAYEGGLKVYDGSISPVMVLLKNKCSDFEIMVANASKVADMFELKEENPEEISFTVEVDEREINALAYSYRISPEESVTFGKYAPLGKSGVEFSEQVFPEMFKDGKTYIHFSLVDSFGNESNEKAMVILKNSSYYGFEFINDPVIISSPDEEFSLSFRQRMVNSLRLGIINENGEAEVSEQLIGLMDKKSGLIPVKLIDYFENIKPSLMRIAAYINDTDELSNFVDVYLDQTRPNVSFDNFDENNYLLHRGSEKEIEVVGTINDPNYFYVGESKKLDASGMKNYIVVKDHRARYLYDGGETRLLYKSGDFFYGIVTTTSFQILDSDKNPINTFSYITDICEENEKTGFICLGKDLFDNYEKNIIENQGGLKIKGELSERITGSSFTDFGSSYIISFSIDAEDTGTYELDLGIQDFEYSFIKNLTGSYTSFELDHMKRAKMDFESSSIVIANTSKPLAYDKFDSGVSNKKLSTKKAGVFDEISILLISTMQGQCFATPNSVSFADDYLNSKETSAIYEIPVVTYYGEPVDMKSFRAEKISEKSYSFSMLLPAVEGFNDFDFSVSDMAGNLFETRLLIEKNDREVTCKIDDSKSLEAVCETVDGEMRLVSNSSSASFIIEIDNETLKQKNSENFIIVRNDRLVKKSKIVSDKGKRNAYITLTELGDDEQFDICYNTETEVIATFSVSMQDFFKILTEKEVVSGANFYFLAIEKEDVAQLKIEHTNQENFSLKYNEDDGYIVIQRTKNDTFVEKMDIKLTAYHESGKIKSGTENVKCVFYNESIVYSSWIDESQMLSDRIISPSYDLYIKTMYSSDIKEVYIYDSMEMNINSRRKYGIFDPSTETYTIKGVTAPIEPSPVTANFVISEGIEVNKELFSGNNVCFYQLDDKLMYSYEKTTDKLMIYLENTTKEAKAYSVKVNSGGKTVFSDEKMEFDQRGIRIIELETKDFYGICGFSIEYINEIGVKRYTGIEDINFSRVGVYAKITGKPQIFIEKITQLNKFSITTNSKVKNLKIALRRSDGFENPVYLNEDFEIEASITTPGLYFLTISYEDANTRTELSRYAFNAINSVQNIFEVTKTAFEKIANIKTLIMKNNSAVNSKKLGACIKQYTNGTYIASYYPEINGDRLEFTMLKNNGDNRYIYEDMFVSEEVAIVTKEEITNFCLHVAEEMRTPLKIYTDPGEPKVDLTPKENKRSVFVSFSNKLYNGAKLELRISHKLNHRLYIFSRNYAAVSGNREWLSIEKEKINSILKEIEKQYYASCENKFFYEEELKEEIKKYIGGNEWKI